MEQYTIDNSEALKNLQGYVLNREYKNPQVKLKDGIYSLQFTEDEHFTIPMSSFQQKERGDIYNWIKSFTPSKEDVLVFGKDNTSNIVSCEVLDNTIELFIEKNGQITSKFIENKFWIVSNKAFNSDWKPLKGNLFYKYIKFYNTRESFYADKRKYKEANTLSVNDAKESAMILNGFSYFKNTKISDVSALFFDIESTSLEHNNTSKVLLISNTFVRQGVITRKLFAYDEYTSDADFLNAWCNWVRDINPSVIAGHNIFSYDLPYLDYCAKKVGTSLCLGRDASNIRFEKWTSKFRKDGSQDYEYTRSYIYGREIIDTMFLAYHFDFARKYESYALKQIIKQEGLEVKDRQHYDASTIHKNYLIPKEWELIKKYAIHDADDAKALYDLMIPAYFYLTPSIPKSFQAINYTASGSQINAFLIRSYLQEGHSLPPTSEYKAYPGAISDGFPGIYNNVFKVDVASLYPSIMLQYEVYDAAKDPNRHFLQMVQYFTKERLINKQKGKETGNRYYKEMEQAQKIVINSAYGLLGARGLLFNSPDNAAMVTEKGRDILKKAVLWASGKEYIEKQEEIEETQDEI